MLKEEDLDVYCCHLQFSVVSEWKTPEEEMVAYRSFRPFFPLMAPAQPFPVQMWASWAIHHVCSKNGEFLLLRSQTMGRKNNVDRPHYSMN